MELTIMKCKNECWCSWFAWYPILISSQINEIEKAISILDMTNNAKYTVVWLKTVERKWSGIPRWADDGGYMYKLLSKTEVS